MGNVFSGNRLLVIDDEAAIGRLIKRTAEGAGFDRDTNVVTLFARDGRDLALPRMTKSEAAQRILDEVVRLRGVLRAKPVAHGSGD